MVATPVGVTGLVGTRRTRRQERSRKKRAQLRKALNATPRKSAFIVLAITVTVIEAVGRGVRWGVLWGLIVLLALLFFSVEKGRPHLSGAGRKAVAGVRQVADMGFGRDPLLFVALWGAGLMVLAYSAAGKVAWAMLFCLLSVFTGLGLWLGNGKKEGAPSDGLG